MANRELPIDVVNADGEEVINVTRTNMKKWLAEWAHMHRTGGCIDDAEAAALTVDEHAELTLESMWPRLKEIADANPVVHS